MGIFSLFKKKEPESDEQILESLALDIQKRQARLADIRVRERRTTLLITLYAFAIWAAYLGAWYVGWRPLKAFPIFIGPVVIQFSRRIAQTWYERIGNAEEKTLKELLSQQHSKLEDIKKKTNYYSTKNLIERFDNSPVSGSPPSRPRPGVPPGQAQAMPQQPTTPQHRPLGQPNGYPQANRGQSPNMSALGAQGPQVPVTPPKKQWFDRLADALLGDDEESPKGRYALICQKCFAHNGLVKEDQWEDTQYVCPKCGQFNPSLRALKESRSPTSPRHSFQAHLQIQRRPAPRMSAPTSGSGSLLRNDELGSDRRLSMPGPEITTLTDEEEEEPKGHRRTRRSPLAQNVSLPDDGDDVNANRQSNTSVEPEEPARRRRLIVMDDN